jgi:antitoxin component YwqK of YwqJK toxin-antitoxin module
MELDKIKEKLSKYLLNPNYVFKYCDNKIIVLEKLPDTITNESRQGIVDLNYAKNRASHLKVILIFDITNVDNEYDSVESDTVNKLTYKKNEIAYPDKFDSDLDKVCTNGIHYYKSIEPIFHIYLSLISYRGYTGTICTWHPNGQKSFACEYDKYKNGHCTCWYPNGTIQKTGNYLKDNKNEYWTYWYENGIKRKEEFYNRGTKKGVWTYYDENGKMSSQVFH